jgi:hypothetical protein
MTAVEPATLTQSRCRKVPEKISPCIYIIQPKISHVALRQQVINKKFVKYFCMKGLLAVKLPLCLGRAKECKKLTHF